MKKFLALLIIMPVLVNAQDKLLIKADEYYTLQQFTNALEIYLKAESKLIDSTAKYPVLLQIASCYANLHNPKQSIQYYSAAYSLDNNFTPEQSTEYSNTLIETGQYTKAKSVLLNLNSGSFIEDILLEKCNYALEHTSTNQYVQITALRLEDGYSNFGMTLYNKRLLYVQNSLTKGFSSSKCRLVYTGTPDIQTRRLMDVNLPFNINSPSFDSEHKTLYFSASASDLKKYNDTRREEEEIGIGGINNLFIYSAILGRNEFIPQKLPFNHIDYSCTHPFITDNGQTLYFSSNMLGGYGGFDLYVVKKTSEGWGTPVNLGKKINTILNEGYPFVNNGYLYFSSDGHPGHGALDIYRYNFKTEEIENLDKPINSSYDDFSYLQNNATEGYFSSNRNSDDGSDVIFRFNNIDPSLQKTQINEPLENTEMAKVNIVVLNYLTGDSLYNISVEVNDKEGPQLSVKSNISGKASFDLPFGKYIMVCSNPDFFTDSTSLSIDQNLYTKTIQLKPDIINTEKLIFRNLTFNYDKAMIGEQSMPIIDKLATLLKLNPSVTIEIGGYTDSRGEEYYNSLISELMAKSVMNYLISKGIFENRITAVGYGESGILNQCIEGVNCSEEEHVFNKRIEIKILSAQLP